MPNSPISASGLNRNPQNIYIYSSGYDPTPSLISNYFSIFEIASSQSKGTIIFDIAMVEGDNDIGKQKGFKDSRDPVIDFCCSVFKEPGFKQRRGH
jgi:hypothetical protein